jgi:voltage-gated potassium channel
VIRFAVLLFFWMRRSKTAGLGMVCLLVLLAVLGNAACFYYFDGAVNADLTVADALWYSVVSITTIGYGDFSATTPGARLGTFFFIIILGMVAFTLLLGMAAEWTADYFQKGQRGMGSISLRDHILVINFPGAARVTQVIKELHGDPQYVKREIVVITDQIETLPFSLPHVSFLHGSPLEEETYRRANLTEAEMAVVLATSYTDPASDAVAASIISIIEHLHPELYSVAECLSSNHRHLFAASNCDAIVMGLDIAGNLLVQELHDHGVAQMIEVITSNREKPTLYSTVVTKVNGMPDYNTVAKALLDWGANFLGVNRGPKTFTSFVNLEPQLGDIVVYLSDHRWTWDEIVRQIEDQPPQVTERV